MNDAAAGPEGASQTTKAVTGLVAAVNLAEAAEGLVLAAKAGLDPAALVRVVTVSSGASTMLGTHGHKMLAGQFDTVTYAVADLRRDLETALELAWRCGVPTPLGAIVHGWALSMARRGQGHLDAAALVTVYEGLAGVRLTAARTSEAPGLRSPTATTTDLRVGFIGLGRMGKPMAACLCRAGFSVVVHNRSHEAVDDLVRQGAQRAATPAEVAAQSDIVLTCLPDDTAVERVYCGPGGLIAAARPGAVLVDFGTTSLALTRRLEHEIAARGALFVDAPVSGGPPRAATGSLTIMVGATEAGFGRASSALGAVGSRIFHLGPPGTGQITKHVNNMLLTTNFAAACEGLALGVAAGIPAGQLLPALLGSSAASNATEVRGRRIVERDFRPAFPTYGQLKDLQAALELGRNLHVPLPLAAVTHELLQSVAARGWGDEDWAAVTKAYESLANLTTTTPSGTNPG